MTKEKILQILAREKPALERDYFIKEIGLFGSFATKKNNTGSDVDIVYEMKLGHYLGLEKKIELENHLKSKLNRKIDLVRLKYMNPAVRIKAEPHLVYV